MNRTEGPISGEMLAETDVSDGLSASGNSVSQGVETVISSEDINVWYDDDHALTDTTMDIPENSVTTIVGPSGCGKSTFLRCINHMSDPIDVARVEGRLVLRRRNVYDDDIDPVALRHRVGMVFQKPNPFPKGIYENVVYGLKIQGINANYGAVIGEPLRHTALQDEVRDRLHESELDFSGGQQQRLCIAHTIATGPEVLLMDGSALALDPVAASQIKGLVEELAEDYAVVIITHNMQQAARISDKTVVFLTGNELVEFDDTQKILENPESQRVEDYITDKFG